MACGKPAALQVAVLFMLPSETHHAHPSRTQISLILKPRVPFSPSSVQRPMHLMSLHPGRFVPPRRLVLASALAGATWSVALSLRAHAPPPAAIAASPSLTCAHAGAHRPVYAPLPLAHTATPALLLLRRPTALTGTATTGRAAAAEEDDRRRRRRREEGEGAAAFLRIQGLAFSP